MTSPIPFAVFVAVALGTATACVEVQDFGAPSSSNPHADSGGGNRDGGSSTSADAGLRLASDGAAAASWEWLNPKPAGNDLRGIWGTARNDIWLVGAAGTVLHWDGTTMTAPYSGAPDETFYAVWSSAPNDVWIAGDGVGNTSSVLHFDGASWSSDYTLSAGLVHSIWGTKATDVWALTGATNGAIQHWDGVSWTVSPIVNAAGENVVTTPILRDLWGASGSDVWAVGESGTLLHWTGAQQGGDGGLGDGVVPTAAWLQSTSSDSNPSSDAFSTSNHYVGVWGSAANDVWAMFVGGEFASPAGSAFGFSHWDGTTWTIQFVTDYTSWCSTLPAGPLEMGHVLWGQDANTILATPWLAEFGTGCQGTNPGNVYALIPGTQSWTVASDVLETPKLGLWAGTAGFFSVTASGGFEQWSPTTSSWDGVLPGATYFELNAIAPVSQDEAWAVSWDGPLLHWQGATWSPVPLDAAADFSLVDVAASGPDDVWVVGQARNPAQGQQTSGAVLHWNGTAWSMPTFPDADFGELTGVWADSPMDAWVVGYAGAPAATPGALVVFHWDGTTWSPITVPPQINAKPRNALYSWAQVSGRSASEVWITGNIYDGADDSYVLQWDGTALTQIMDRPRGWSTPTKASAAGPNDVWLAAQPGEVFNGKDWATIDGSDYLNNAVFAAGSADVWLVGQGLLGGAIRHWDGTGVTTPLDVTPILYSMGVTPKRDFLWVAGAGGATLRLPIPTSGAIR